MKRSKRFEILEERPVNKDGFVQEWPETGFVAMESPNDPKPSIKVENGRIVELDGKRREDFDMLDQFISDYTIDASITDERAAILPGDVIISVKIKNKKTRSITSLKDFFKFTKELGNFIPVLMLIQRGNCTFFIPFEIKNQNSEK